ncbi:MAG: AgmX/PglI C-terminal domain-containing protein, partial [Gammaproteobacteria bacterium]|nr:AgmX/PglI C-terminal domain-containing protein [Gammaproteobacteria bacterium]
MSDIRQRQEEVNAGLEEAYQQLVALKEKQEKIEHELSTLLVDNQQYVVLSDVIDHLDKLTKLGGEKLFWGDDLDRQGIHRHSERVHSSVHLFENNVRELTQKRDKCWHEIQITADDVNELNEQTLLLAEREEDAKHEFVIDREIVDHGYRPMAMPWTVQGEDEKRFRKILLITLLLTITFGFLIPLWEIPEPDRTAKVEVPERLAKFLMKKKPPPPPPPPPKEEVKPDDTPKKKAKEKPTKKETKVARKKAERSGLMAFKNDFADLMDDDIDKKLGAQARISNSGRTAKISARSIIATQAGAGTAGINTASLSKNVGGAGKGIEGVAFSRIESSIGTAFDGEESPLSSGPGPSRTDEEIQIVFDKYKAALYRIYNRQLRKDPSLQGKMVLRLTIAADGKVTACKVDSSDMDSP